MIVWLQLDQAELPVPTIRYRLAGVSFVAIRR